MRRLYKVYAAVVVLVIITLLLVKGPGMTPEIEISFTVSGILYAILVGFFLSGTWSRLVDLRENVIKETSFLETSHRIFSKFKDRKGYERLSGAIKDYVYLYLTLEWVEMDRADKKFREVIDSITGMKARDSKEEGEKESVLEDIDSVLEAKGNQKILSLNAISVYHWAIIYVLSFVITASLFFANNTTMAFIMGALFIPAIILVMFLLYDMDNCKWGEADTSIEPYLDVLRSMKVKEPGYLKKAHYAPTKRSTSKLFRFFYPTYE